MRKQATLFVAFGLLLAASGLCDAQYVVRLKKQSPATSYLPSESYLPSKIIRHQKEFKKICNKAGKPCKHYGSIKLLESQNTGRLWPKTRRKLTHKVLDQLENEMKSFPSAKRKRKAIKNLEKRISYFEIVK